MRARLRTIVVGFLACTLIGALFAAQFVLYSRFLGRTISWGQSLTWNLGAWYLWGLMCPGIFRFLRAMALPPIRRIGVIVAHVAFGVLTSAIHVLAYAAWTHFTVPISPGPPDWWREVQDLFARGYSWDLFCYAAIAAGFFAAEFARRHREGLVRASRLEAQLAQAQLDALRMQLQPHFLFNTLNTIASLVRDDPNGAEDMIMRLGDLLRAAMDKGRSRLIPLREELDFAAKYLDIQKVRFGDRLDVRMDATPDSLDAQVPTFLLQPLIENAVRHGLDSDDGRCHVRVTARTESGGLRIEIRDSGPGLRNETGRAAREGIGLSNTRARLRQAFGDAARLELSNASPSGCIVSIQVPGESKLIADGGGDLE